jgi:predicted transcriptional regulator
MSLELDITLFRPDRHGIRKVLGDLEADIMELIWQRPTGVGTTVRDIFEILYQQRHLAYTTVMSTMTRLAKKKLLQVEKREPTYIYTPAVTKQELISYLISHILEDLFVSFSGQTLVDVDALSDQEAATHARKLLNEITHHRVEEAG